MSKYKLINDPVHGFITIPNALVFQIIEHKFFQRLRRISQMAMANYVYPGAQHTRFHHALGAMHLMQKAIDVLRKKEVSITYQEEEAALCAILLHDIGHGPFSHALEFVMTEGINHEFFSEQIIRRLNKEFQGKLDLALEIFNGTYKKHFLHELVSSQLDVDRLDYLARDSFFSGVYEGKISTERIISMLNVINDQLVVEEKGVYSIEKYIISRRLMYWQVYFHKTALCAEEILISCIKRAKFLATNNNLRSSSHMLNHFLTNAWSKLDFTKNEEHINAYCQLDDFDVMFAIKEWQNSSDFILSTLCKALIERKLFKVKMKDERFSDEKLHKLTSKVMKNFNLSKDETNYFILTGSVQNTAYEIGEDKLKILTKKGKVKDITSISDQINSDHLTRSVKKFFVCYPKNNI